MSLLFVICEWIVVVISFGVFFLLCLWVWSTFQVKSPFFPIARAVLADIYKALDVKEGSVVYDLGSGDGRVLFYGAHLVPGASYKGIEKNSFALVLFTINKWLHRKEEKTHVTIIKEDFFKHNLSDATHIFVYLSPKLLDDLLAKFENELKPGTRLVSASYQFTLRRPKMEIDLGRHTYQLSRKLYVYDF